jgi:hypothetical protein
MRVKWKFFSIILVSLTMIACASIRNQPAHTLVKPGFVKLPKEGFEHSAYIQCNPTGDYGKSVSKSPQDIENKACFVTTAELEKSENFAPIPGFKMVGMQISDVAMPKPYASEQNNAVAVVTDTFWRNESKTECILGTHLYMQDVPLADGSYWEVNDVARSGFAGMDVEIAYFYKPHSKEVGGNTEVLFRAGRTFTSVATDKITGLPSLKNAPASNMAISKNNSAAVSENWVNFTTDVSYKDIDGNTRHMTSMFYIKYPCDARNVVSKDGAIRFRTTGQNNKQLLEIDAPGLVPVDAVVEKF